MSVTNAIGEMLAVPVIGAIIGLTFPFFNADAVVDVAATETSIEMTPWTLRSHINLSGERTGAPVMSRDIHLKADGDIIKTCTMQHTSEPKNATTTTSAIGKTFKLSGDCDFYVASL